MSQNTYNITLLNNFCKKNNIKLLNDYCDEKINCRTIIIFYCTVCNKENSKRFSYLINRNTLCKSCVTKKSFTKQKITMMEKYGVEHVSKMPGIKQKIKDSFIKKYGVDNSSKTKEVQEKMKKTCLERYGVEYLVHNKEIKQKMKNTCLEKYGSENCLGNKEIQQKIKDVNIKKYGVDNPGKLIEFQEKMKKTMVEKYGVEYPLQNPEISQNSVSKCFQTKEYTFPSKNIIKYQGYENFALDDIIKNNICEEDIITIRKYVPTIWYNDDNNIKRRHFVDIFIPSKNLCIEVKSKWTLNLKISNIFLKQKAAKEMGYNYEIWVYDHKGNKINCFE